MTYIASNPPSAHSQSLFMKVAANLQVRAGHRNARSDHKKLLKMSNRELMDIGLTRDDVGEVLRQLVSWQVPL